MIKNVKNKLFELLTPAFSEKGFKLKKTKSLYTKQTENAEFIFNLFMRAKYSRLSIDIHLQVLPKLMNATLQKDLGLDKNDNFSFRLLIPKEHFKVITWKNDTCIRLYDGSLDIPEKEWLDARNMSIADYLHPIERIEAGAQNIMVGR